MEFRTRITFILLQSNTSLHNQNETIEIYGLYYTLVIIVENMFGQLYGTDTHHNVPIMLRLTYVILFIIRDRTL